jgi:peptide/nickel transport system ATP-binding protein
MTVAAVDAAPLIELRDVSVRFPGRADPAVENVSLEVHSGAALGIVGESGSGKTTLARALVGALKPTGGSVEVSGRPWSDIRRKDPLRRSIQMIFQDPYGSLSPWQTALRTVAEVLEQWHPMSRRQANVGAAELLAEVGLSSDAMHRRPSQLSGGQCQRVGIARALACDPDVLVADEPTSSLDVSVQAQILNLLLSLRTKRSLALVLISHDLMVVDYMTAEAIIMYKGHVVERGPTRRLLQQPQHPYTRVLIDSIPGREGGAEFVANAVVDSKGCVFAARCAHMQAKCLTDPPALEDDSAGAVACHYPLGTRPDVEE